MKSRWRSLRRCCHGSSNRKRPNRPDPAQTQRPAAGLQRRARRHHVVDEHDAAVAQQASRAADARERPQAERFAHVARAPRGRQARLRRAVPDPAKHAPHRQPELAGQIVGLIESAAQGTTRMEWHGHHRIGAAEHIAAGLPHQPGERRRQRPPLLVPEDVKDLAQGAFVTPGASRQVEVRRPAPAARAERTGRPPRRQGVSAANAERRRDGAHAPPA